AARSGKGTPICENDSAVPATVHSLNFCQPWAMKMAPRPIRAMTVTMSRAMVGNPVVAYTAFSVIDGNCNYTVLDEGDRTLNAARGSGRPAAAIDGLEISRARV